MERLSTSNVSLSYGNINVRSENNFCSTFALKFFRATFANADTGSLLN